MYKVSYLGIFLSTLAFFSAVTWRNCARYFFRWRHRKSPKYDRMIISIILGAFFLCTSEKNPKVERKSTKYGRKSPKHDTLVFFYHALGFVSNVREMELWMDIYFTNGHSNHCMPCHITCLQSGTDSKTILENEN